MNCTVPLSAYAKSRSIITRYYNGIVLRDHQLIYEDLWVSEGKIIPPQPSADKNFNVEGAIIAPGYIDIQINGAFGHDFTSEPESVGVVACQLPKYGVTAFLPTMVSSAETTYRNHLPKLLSEQILPPAAAVLGVHLEGPFFCSERHGAHDIEVLDTFERIQNLETIYGSLSGVKIITLAPELPGALEVIKILNSKGIIVSAGHSNASYEEMQLAIKAGVTCATHLFNAMRPLHHREPGIIGAVLTKPHFNYSMIADNQHVHPVTINLCWKANPSGLILVTDAIAALGLADGSYVLGGQSITLKDGIANISGTGTLAGGSIGMDQAVRNLYHATGCSVIEAIEAASYKPARLLKIEDKKGTLNIGADADFLLLDNNLELIQCYVSGISYHDQDLDHHLKDY